MRLKDMKFFRVEFGHYRWKLVTEEGKEFFGKYKKECLYKLEAWTNFNNFIKRKCK
jgi:hypothetical protein